MVLSAEKARAKAEARRARILAKSAERLDVVSGLTPIKSDVAVDDNNDEPAFDGVGGVDGDEGADKANDNENNNTEAAATTAAENDNISSNSNKGARRMAAMRRRRYQAKKKEEESNDNNADDTEGADEEKKGADVEKIDGDNKTTAEEEPTLIQDTLEEKETNEKENDDDDGNEEEEATAGEDGTTKKKYMGVARMRRKIIKEQKAQRIAELEAAVSSESGDGGNGTDAIDAAATMAAMGMTASMIRKGSSTEGDLSDVAIKTLQKKKKSWWKLIFPPMSLVPRLVTLTLLFMAGLDVGLEPHRMMTTNTSGSMLSETDNNVASGGAGSGVHLIYHVESALTKPWEYGMGGKARHMMGMMETAPPTSLPTSFKREDEEFCIDGDGGVGKECDAKEGVSTSKEKEMEMKEKLLSGENEEDNSLLPKGVSTSEFDDDDIGDGKDAFSPPVIDPIFRVDLDDLLQNSQLPAPINFCAKFAIGFHRMWVRYLWTIPTSVVTSVVYSPKTLVDSWMANPPVFLFISLLIRMIVRLLLGNTSSLSDEEDEDGSGGGKKKDNLDVLGKIKDTALNYATSSFPKTILVLKTLKEVVTVDMYVILCGLLVGLVAPLVKEDFGFGKSSGGGHVLGDGEL